MLNELELNLLDFFEKSTWNKKRGSYWLTVDNEEDFIFTIKKLKFDIGFSLFLDLFASESDQSIDIYYYFYHPIFKKQLILKYKLIDTFNLISIKDYWKAAELKEYEIYDFYRLHIVRSKSRHLFVPSDFKELPGLSIDLKNKLLNSNRILINSESTSSRLLPLNGNEEELSFDHIDKYNCPTGKIVLNNNIVKEVSIDYGNFHKGIESKIVSNGFSSIEEILEEVDHFSYFENKISFYMLCESILNIKVSSNTKVIRTILLELEKLYKNLSLFLNLCKIKKFSFLQQVEKLYIKTHAIIENVKSSLSLNKTIKNSLYDLTEIQNELISIIDTNNLKKLLKSYKNSSISSYDDIVNIGVTGPTLRSCGMNLDWRDISDKLIYDELSFSKKLYSKGSLLDRYCVRLDDIFSSFKLILILLDTVKVTDDISITNNIKLDELNKSNDGEFVNFIESTNGLLIHSIIIKDGIVTRYRISSPDIMLIKLFQKIINGENVSDCEVIWNSLGINLNMVER